MINHRSLSKSFGYAYEGIIYAYRHNQNLRIHFFAAIIVILAGLFFHITYLDMIVILIMILLAISAEMINTSIEKMTDLIVQEHRIEAKIAKDVAAGMVLVMSIGSVIVGAIIFLPYIFVLLHIT